MQTQGISLQVSAMKSMSTGKSTKVNKSTFDSFMSQNASKADVKKDNIAVASKSGKQQNVKNEVESNSSKDAFQANKLTVNSPKTNQNDLEDVNMDELSSQIVSFLKDSFGMSEEDIVDIFEQLGLSPADLAFTFNQETLQATPVNIENVKDFLMDVHGVEDSNLFLMSDQLSGELNDVIQGIQDILSKDLGMDVKQLTQDDNSLLQSFSEKIAQLVQSTDVNKNAVIHDSTEEVDTDVISNEVMPDAKEEIPVVVEMSSDTDSSGLSKESSKEMPTHTEPKVAESPINTFVDRLSQSFDRFDTSETVSTRVTMNNIVEQVVNHVKIRVMPQTTSMELQLNPESLGRVNLHVSSNNGTATATLTVQNQVAKEALESQISVLRENLESQGLKVDSVEVNVSEFGFKNPEDSNHGQPQKKKGSGRRFQMDAGNDIMDEEITSVTSQDRQDGNSVVDYTA